MNPTMRAGWLHSALRLKVATALGALVLIGIITGGTFLARQARRERMAIPDERAAGAALLAQKLSGPRYFHAPSPAAGHGAGSGREGGDGEPRIGVDEARAQVDGVVAARGLDARGAAKVRKLIERLAEPPDYRAVGEPSVNLLRLNLALDEVH